MQTILKTTFRASAVALATGLLYLSACKKDENNPQGQATVAKQIITAQGGSLASLDKAVTVSLPAGAVNASTEVSIEKTSEKAPKGIGNVYKITPEGTVFAKPVSISFAYTDSDAAKTNPALMGIAYKKNDGTWQPVPVSKIDRKEKRIFANTLHFSEWTLMEQAEGLTVHTVSTGTVNIPSAMFSYELKGINNVIDSVLTLQTPFFPPQDTLTFLMFAPRQVINKNNFNFFDFTGFVQLRLRGRAFVTYTGLNYPNISDNYDPFKKEDFQASASFHLIEVATQPGEYSIGDFKIPIESLIDQNSRKVEWMTASFRIRK